MLAATILGSSIAFVDATVVNVALPALQADLDATLAELQWVVEAYALTLAALILVGGTLGDQLGRARIFGAGVALFAAASVWCGLAPDSTQLIAARGVQGVGAALLVPGSLAIISETFSESQRGRAIGTWSAFTVLAMAAGPPLGGWLVDEVSWRWIFFINVPPALLVLWILARHVPRGARQPARGFDPAGAVLATAGLGALVFALIEAGRIGLATPLVLSTLSAGVVLLGLFVHVEARARSPMLPLGLFRNRNFSAANAITLMLYAALGGSLFFLPFALIQVHGYSATQAGASFLPLVAIMFVLSRWSGGLVDRIGGRLPLTVGPMIAAAGFILFAPPVTGGTYWQTFFPAMVVLGFGMAIIVAPLTTVVMTSVADEAVGAASGVNNAASRVAAVLAVAVMGLLAAAVFNAGLSHGLGALDIPADVLLAIEAERVKLAGAVLPAGIEPTLAIAIEAVIDDAFIRGYRAVMALAAALALASALTAALALNSKSRPAADAR